MSHAISAPSTGSADCLTTDGRVVTIRAARPDDVDAVIALHDRSSDETRYARFFNIHRYLSPEDAQRFVTVDHRTREALVVVDHGEIVGLAGYEGTPDRTTAEVAFLIEDAHQRRGIGSLLLEHLVTLARSQGIHRLEALVLPTNHQMLGVFANAGFEQVRTLEPGEITLTLDIDDTSRAAPSIEAREHAADVASMRRILQPASIAFVTGPLEDDPIGRALADRCSARFGGRVHAVNPDGLPVGTAAGHRSVADLPDAVDLAVITVPEADLATTLTACGGRGIGGCVVTAPIIDRCAALGLRHAARAAGTRLVGPGSTGLADRHRGLDALIDARDGLAGPIALGCQSTAIARALAVELDERGVGVASIVTLGAKADVSGNDLLQAWSDDPDVRVVVLQLESLGNPRRFARIVRRVGRSTPVVLLRTAGLHDLLPHEDRELLAQLGVVDVPTVEEAVAVAELLATEPRPSGRRVRVVSEHRGPGLLAVDRLRDEGLEVVALTADVAAADPGETDVVFLVDDVDADVVRAATPRELSVVVAGTADRSTGRMARALGRAAAHASWARRSGRLADPPVGVDRVRARSELLSRPGSVAGWIDLDTAAAVIGAYGIRVTAPHPVTSAADAAEVAGQVGYPVVLDHRGAHDDRPLDEVRTLPELAAAWDRALDRNGPAVLPMAVLPAGPLAELQVHVTPHPQLGPVLRIVAADRRCGPALRLLPMEEAALDELVDDIVGQPRSGLEPEALRDLLVRISALVLDNPELVELHLDSVDAVSYPASVVGAHLRVGTGSGMWDDQVRHLRRDDIGAGR
jgi:acyl-CoA synthetase (NDP forming)/RimJ/RimL family protein N-acetyltransferase